MLKCLYNLKEEAKTSSVLSEFYESVDLVSKSIFGLFINIKPIYLCMDSVAIQKVEDLLKRKIISLCRTLDYSNALNLLD